jgi:hypothetical protein
LDAISSLPRQGAVVDGARACIIVCGLHRSGTSAVTRLINLLGADVADDLLPATPDNSRGYWESQAVIAIHSQLLKSVTTGQRDRFDPAPLPAGWLATDAAREARRRLANVIRADYSDSSLFVVKDPRIARLLPLWIEVLQDLDIAPTVVIPFRNPLEVAQSLARRDQVSLPKALLLYLHVYLELELASRSVPRVFVRYDHLLRDWHPFARRITRMSGLGLMPPSEGVAIEIERFLTDGLYHHRCCREQMIRQPEVAPAIVELFDTMNEAAETGRETRLRHVRPCRHDDRRGRAALSGLRELRTSAFAAGGQAASRIVRGQHQLARHRTDAVGQAAGGVEACRRPLGAAATPSAQA